MMIQGILSKPKTTNIRAWFVDEEKVAKTKSGF